MEIRGYAILLETCVRRLEHPTPIQQLETGLFALPVIPSKEGNQLKLLARCFFWIPIFMGMTSVAGTLSAKKFISGFGLSYNL
jgi:hypothetical protein